MAECVSYEVEDGVAVLTIANPPVNALSWEVRRGLADGLEAALADPDVDVIVIIGEGNTLSVGADISEFGAPFQNPGLPEVCNRIEASEKPVLAALHGNVLGGGFEVALSTHYRVASLGTRFGLPEVTLGLLPGAGGTQRMPRLAGANLSLEVMLSGQSLPVDDARASALFDALVEGDLREGAIAYARELIEEGAPVRPTRDATVGFADPLAYQGSLARARARVSGKPENAPREIVNCIEAAMLLPFEQGLAFEWSAFENLLVSEQSAALRHAFFAERKAAKFPELAGVSPRDVRQVGIVGGGTMGSGIAMACLGAGLKVVLVERGAAALDAALTRIDGMFDRNVARGRLSSAARDEKRAALDGATDLVALADVDMVIEAVPEELDAKLLVFSQLDGVVKEGAVLASNTSYMDVNRMARETGSPEDVLGLHFFSPAHVMRLVEVIVADETAPEVTATAVALARRLGKIPVRAGMSDGFIGNRILSAYRFAADMMLEEGATPYLIDEAMEDWGMTLGPYKVQDMAGLDISWARRKRLAETRDPAERYVAIGDRLCEAGRLGQKAGRGYYLYVDGAREGTQDPEVIALIRTERERKGISPRGFKPDEIQRRCLAAMVNEGARLLREGVATRPSDIDTVMMHGYGFPRWRGGPMMAADLVGLLKVKSDLDLFAREEPRFWAPEPIFDGLIKNGQGFDSLND